MTLYYCAQCGSVYAFNLPEIRKHGLLPISDRTCVACGAQVLLPVGEIRSEEY